MVGSNAWLIQRVWLGKRFKNVQQKKQKKKKKKSLLATPPKSLLYYLEETQVWYNKKIYLALFLVSKIFGISWIERVIVPWTIRRSNQSILKEISPEYLLEDRMLKLKVQYFGHLMWRADSLEKTLMLRKTEGRRRRRTEDEMVGWHHQFDGHEFEQAPGDGDEQGSLGCSSPWGWKEWDTIEWLNGRVYRSIFCYSQQAPLKNTCC